MRDFGVRFERVPLMYDNTSVISVAKKSSLPQKDETCWEETPLPERSYREGGHWDEVYRHRETVDWHFHQTPWFFSICWFEGGIIGYHPYGLVWVGVGAFSLYIVYFAFLLHFPHTHLSHFASHIILVCICLIMPITVLGWVVMRCEPVC
jgi:hypothetical protein